MSLILNEINYDEIENIINQKETIEKEIKDERKTKDEKKTKDETQSHNYEKNMTDKLIEINIGDYEIEDYAEEMSNYVYIDSEFQRKKTGKMERKSEKTGEKIRKKKYVSEEESWITEFYDKDLTSNTEQVLEDISSKIDTANFEIENCKEFMETVKLRVKKVEGRVKNIEKMVEKISKTVDKTEKDISLLIEKLILCPSLLTNNTSDK
ncbi:MAG TPA: hypothetical protein VN704_00560 [Verrucomicrobiae bacterium]|nr:hypothetical protein [Verrucomicrobiae bacterium]